MASVDEVLKRALIRQPEPLPPEEEVKAVPPPPEATTVGAMLPN